ncbi:MAG: ABC transporter ATP-binding protein [Spirochaetales bacterium]
MAFLELQGVSAGYSKHELVLKNFSLSLEKGNLISLLGPSGCGKTTTLRIIAGFLTPVQGKVILEGKDITHTPPHKRNLGIVFQSYALFPHLSVFDNVAFGLRMRKLPKEEIARKVAKALQITDLSGLEHRLPSQLSGGQKQRVALSRALVIEPSLLLLDEPLSNLDAKLRVSMRAELSRIQKTLGITMIYVTHDQIEALSLSNEVVVMQGGRIEQKGPPHEIYQSPATPFVAQFLGYDNVMEARVQKFGREEWSLLVGDTALSLPSPSRVAGVFEPGSVREGDELEIRFRSEDGKLSPTPTPCSLPVTVLFGTFMGKAIQYLVRRGEGEYTVLSSEGPLYQEGQLAYLELDTNTWFIQRKEKPNG